MKRDLGRTFPASTTAAAKLALGALQEPSPPSRYAATMKKLGAELGTIVRDVHGPFVEPVALVITPEDADALATGLISKVPARHLKLVCYWTKRHSFPHGDFATVTQRFIDPTLKSAPTAIILKSIISTGCVVRAHIETLLTKVQPERIIIAAPVMFKGADRELKKSFPKQISDRFEFVTLATDSKKDGDVVRPGIGGMVYERLGLKDRPPRALPKLIEARIG